MSDKSVDNGLNQGINYTDNAKIEAKFYGSCWKEKKVTTLKQVVSTFIVYVITLWSYMQGADFTFRNYLFGTVRLTENAVPDKYSYSGYGIGFDARSVFLLIW